MTVYCENKNCGKEFGGDVPLGEVSEIDMFLGVKECQVCGEVQAVSSGIVFEDIQSYTLEEKREFLQGIFDRLNKLEQAVNPQPVLTAEKILED